MADKLLDLPGLTYYDGKIKTYIAEKDSEVTSNLEQQLQQEAQTREAADTQLQQNINTEASTRAQNDSLLQQNIDTEESARIAADTTLQQNIDKEATTRSQADNTLQDNIDAEESAREAADIQLQNNIDAEESARQQADTQLNTKIDTTKAEILGDVSKEYNTLGKLEDAIQAEVSRATNAEESIDADLQSFKTSTNESIEQINDTLDSHNTRITNLEENTVKKTGETSQTIQGNIAIQGDLTVTGTTTSQDHETIMVQDNIIVTNSNGVPIVGLSGIAIRMNSTKAFGIVYDPATDELKSGIGTLNESNEFTFDGGEGYPVTLRDSDADLVDGNILMWDNVGKRLVDGGILANNIAQQNGNYQEMFVGRATSDANGNNIADTYLEKDVIPQPTAEDNGKILGVQNSVYTLMENRQGTYYVDLNDITLTDEDTSGTLSADLVQQLADENCLGVLINATYADTSSVVKRAFYKVYSGSITEMSSSVCAFLSTDALRLAQSAGATRYTELTISQALFGVVYTDTSSTAQYSLSNFSSGQFTLTKPSRKTSVTSNMTQEVYVDNNGKLWTLPVQGGINWATNKQIDDMF